MFQEHLDAVWRAALAASANPRVAEAVTTAVLRAAQRDAAEDELVRRAVLAAVRRAPAPAFARMRRPEREAVALARIARCPVPEIAAALGIGDGAARRLLTAGLRSVRHRRPASAPRTLPPVLGCGIAAS
jgi:DNA-directed RNA polymerase specialized sigma24 family protein